MIFQNAEYEGARPDERRAMLKRIALQVADQLPQGKEEALTVLEYAKHLVEQFLSPSQGDAPSIHAVASFPTAKKK